MICTTPAESDLLHMATSIGRPSDDEWEQVFDAQSEFSFTLADVATCITAAVEHGDWAETEVWALLRLRDGRYAYITGGCDTTGWDCRSSGSDDVADSLEELYPKIDDEGARRLFGISRTATR